MYYSITKVKENIALLRTLEITKPVLESVVGQFPESYFAEISSFLACFVESKLFDSLVITLTEQYCNYYEFIAANEKRNKKLLLDLEWTNYCKRVLKKEEDATLMEMIEHYMNQTIRIDWSDWCSLFAAINNAVFQVRFDFKKKKFLKYGFSLSQIFL